MTDSIYNNAGMPSEQGAAPPSNLMVRCQDCGGTQIWKRTSASEIEVYHDCFSGKHSRECFAALTLERDTLKAERDERAEQVRRYDKAIGVLTEDNAALKAKVERLNTRCPVCGGRDVISNGPYGYTCHHCADLGIIESLEAKVERLSAPVSDEEWTNVVVVSPQHDHRTWMERKQVNSIIAARASAPPTHTGTEGEDK